MFFLVSQVLSFRHAKQISKNVADTTFKDNIWAAGLAKMGSLFSENQGVKCFLYVIDVFTKYIWVQPLKDKKAKTVLNGFIAIRHESKYKPNKLWVDQ